MTVSLDIINNITNINNYIYYFTARVHYVCLANLYSVIFYVATKKIYHLREINDSIFVRMAINDREPTTEINLMKYQPLL